MWSIEWISWHDEQQKMTESIKVSCSLLVMSHSHSASHYQWMHKFQDSSNCHSPDHHHGNKMIRYVHISQVHTANSDQNNTLVCYHPDGTITTWSIWLHVDFMLKSWWNNISAIYTLSGIHILGHVPSSLPRYISFKFLALFCSDFITWQIG